MTQTKLLTTSEVAQQVNVTPETVRGYCLRKIFPNAVKSNGIWIIPQTDVDAWTRSGYPGPKEEYEQRTH